MAKRKLYSILFLAFQLILFIIGFQSYVLESYYFIWLVLAGYITLSFCCSLILYVFVLIGSLILKLKNPFHTFLLKGSLLLWTAVSLFFMVYGLVWKARIKYDSYQFDKKVKASEKQRLLKALEGIDSYELAGYDEQLNNWRIQNNEGDTFLIYVHTTEDIWLYERDGMKINPNDTLLLAKRSIELLKPFMKTEFIKETTEHLNSGNYCLTKRERNTIRFSIPCNQDPTNYYIIIAHYGPYQLGKKKGMTLSINLSNTTRKALE